VRFSPNLRREILPISGSRSRVTKSRTPIAFSRSYASACRLSQNNLSSAAKGRTSRRVYAASPITSTLILYRPSGDGAAVARVVHGRRDLPNIDVPPWVKAVDCPIPGVARSVAAQDHALIRHQRKLE
jgi:hypothetical protein